MALVQMDYETKQVTYIKKVDITRYTHNTVCECKLHHTHHITDYVLHFVHEYRNVFDSSEHVFIERQPPTGLVAVEALLFSLFREKMTLVSPNSMHKHFMIGHLDYEGRKKKTQAIAEPYVGALEYYQGQVRKHDMSDAVCILLYEFSKMKKKEGRDPTVPRLSLDEYRYIKTKSLDNKNDEVLPQDAKDDAKQEIPEAPPAAPRAVEVCD